MQVHDKKFKIYIDDKAVSAKVKELGAQVMKDYEGKEPILIGVLNGAFMFLSELAKNIDMPAEFSFIKYSSYIDTKSSGKVVQLIGFDREIEGRDVIIVEDIIDTGLTMKSLLGELIKYKPASIKLASLLFKPEALQTDVKIDYLGFEIKNEFVVGYGLDYNGLGRNLPHIYVLDED
ncbi:hypoxanthine phosphoribosyltransferase [Flammeovirgaceae bacterium SG7u.111]|nr:hypoxanthine phosphoribosyltransferase [Flammeovirgaceae bacterium SG7u.132]WPO34961.1 hypoxanthine phosphoribosyltransferase [Flammeovirgaceae bacterium SG7u.111]